MILIKADRCRTIFEEATNLITCKFRYIQKVIQIKTIQIKPYSPDIICQPICIRTAYI